MTTSQYLTFFLIPFFILVYVVLWVITRDRDSTSEPEELDDFEVTSDELERTLNLMLQHNLITQQEYNKLLVQSLPFSR